MGLTGGLGRFAADGKAPHAVGFQAGICREFRGHLRDAPARRGLFEKHVEATQQLGRDVIGNKKALWLLGIAQIRFLKCLDAATSNMCPKVLLQEVPAGISENPCAFRELSGTF